MNYSVLRKSLSTTSLIAVAAMMAACSGEMERFGSPGSGYTSNQQEIFTNSTRSVPVQAAVNQPMPAAVAPVQQPQYQTPVYTTPTSVPVVAAANPSPVSLTTGSIKRSPLPSTTYQPMPEPVSTQVASRTVYESVPVKTPVQVPVASNGGVDYTATSAIRNPALNKPPVVVSRFDSLPKSGPKPHTSTTQVASRAPIATSQRMPVTVPVSAQTLQQKPVEQKSRFSISKFFSLPKNAPKNKNIDYQSTASIVPPANIPTGNSVYNAPVQPAQAPVSNNAAIGSARTSGQWTSVGGTMVTLRNGENIETMSRRYGVPVKALTEINGIVDPSFAVPGQQVLIPVYQQAGAESFRSAPQTVASAAPAMSQDALPASIRTPRANLLRLQSRSQYGQDVIRMQQAANAEGKHQVMPGDSLGSVASRYGVSVSSLARANGLSQSASLRMGQRLTIPQRGVATPTNDGIDYTTTASINRQAVNVPAAAAPIASVPMRLTEMPKSKPRALVQRAATQAQAKAKVERKEVASTDKSAVGLPDVSSGSGSAPAASSNSSDAGAPQFRWPVRGRIISNFGRKQDGGQNDGINLSVPAGTPVRVAESGTVIYAGDKLKGFGNLVLVQHANGWVTAYAHNEKILVSKGQQVRRGQIISQAGKSGNVTSPQLHFELRIKGDPVDPVPYLV